VTQKTNRGRYPVPVEEAVRLYAELGSWEKVRQQLRRPDGSMFTYWGIWRAVRWRDQGNAGYYVA
jgi:S-adenosylmethionine:diacylglycerol 3-amino-3-carboxypropyl transferase